MSYRFHVAYSCTKPVMKTLDYFRQHAMIHLSIWLLAWYCPLASAGSITSDPVGDTFGSGQIQHDITVISTQLTDNELHLNINFNSSITPPTAFQTNVVAGYIDFDLDANAATGSQSHVSQFGQSVSGIGVELYVDLFSEGDPFLLDGVTPRPTGMVNLVDALTATAIEVLPISYESASLSISIPRSSMPTINGLFSWGIIVGTLDDTTDQAIVRTVPESATVWLLMVSILTVLHFSRFKG